MACKCKNPDGTLALTCNGTCQKKEFIESNAIEENKVFVKCCRCAEDFSISINCFCEKCTIEELKNKIEKYRKKSFLYESRVFAIQLVLIIVPSSLTQYYFNTKIYILCMGFLLLGNIAYKFSKWFADLI
jgi:hypothetical protein